MKDNKDIKKKKLTNKLIKYKRKILENISNIIFFEFPQFNSTTKTLTFTIKNIDKKKQSDFLIDIGQLGPSPSWNTVFSYVNDNELEIISVTGATYLNGEQLLIVENFEKGRKVKITITFNKSLKEGKYGVFIFNNEQDEYIWQEFYIEREPYPDIYKIPNSDYKLRNIQPSDAKIIDEINEMKTKDLQFRPLEPTFNYNKLSKKQKDYIKKIVKEDYFDPIIILYFENSFTLIEFNNERIIKGMSFDKFVQDYNEIDFETDLLIMYSSPLKRNILDLIISYLLLDRCNKNYKLIA